jgi:hypothetical protein
VQSSRGRMDTKWLLQHLKNEKKGSHAWKTVVLLLFTTLYAGFVPSSVLDWIHIHVGRCKFSAVASLSLLSDSAEFLSCSAYGSWLVCKDLCWMQAHEVCGYWMVYSMRMYYHRHSLKQCKGHTLEFCKEAIACLISTFMLVVIPQGEG